MLSKRAYISFGQVYLRKNMEFFYKFDAHIFTSHHYKTMSKELLQIKEAKFKTYSHISYIY